MLWKGKFFLLGNEVYIEFYGCVGVGGGWNVVE